MLLHIQGKNIKHILH